MIRRLRRIVIICTYTVPLNLDALGLGLGRAPRVALDVRAAHRLALAEALVALRELHEVHGTLSPPPRTRGEKGRGACEYGHTRETRKRRAQGRGKCVGVSTCHSPFAFAAAPVRETVTFLIGFASIGSNSGHLSLVAIVDVLTDRTTCSGLEKSPRKANRVSASQSIWLSSGSDACSC